MELSLALAIVSGRIYDTSPRLGSHWCASSILLAMIQNQIRNFVDVIVQLPEKLAELHAECLMGEDVASQQRLRADVQKCPLQVTSRPKWPELIRRWADQFFKMPRAKCGLRSDVLGLRRAGCDLHGILHEELPAILRGKVT